MENGFTNYQFLGGSFGYFCNQWLNEAVGKIGSFFFLIFIFFLAITILFNPVYPDLK